ncbi:photosynthetic complex assembly protein PuhC [Sphingomonas sp. GlSt437]|uniref:photosynthetic complex assembly protein PuhC n=1 Tax=Sphingomonas sp. GlSt437 TaxID=3389970 RepID=UPI003A849864
MTALHRPHDPTVPPGALIAAGVLVVSVIATAGFMRLAQVPAAATPALVRAADHAVPVTTRVLSFADRADGGVAITDVTSGRLVRAIEPGEQQGFIRGVMRGMARDRKLRGIGAAQPFTLTLWQDGQLSLIDRTTGRALELGGFGETNRQAFLALLTTPEATK